MARHTFEGARPVTGSRSRYLAEFERAVLETRRHWAVLVMPCMAALGAMLGASVIGAVTSPDDGADFLDTVVGLVAIFFALRLGFKALLWWVDRIVVTDQRIFEVSGVLTRRVASMPLEKVTDMTYRRTVWGRLIGFGDLIVETAGQRQAMDNIAYLPHPDDFYRTVTSLVTTHIPPSPDDLEEPPPGPDEDDTGPLPRVIL